MIASQRSLEKLAHIFDQLRGAHDIRIERLATREGEHLRSEFAAARDGIAHHAQAAQQVGIVLRLQFDELQVGGNNLQHVVEVVRDAARQVADGFELLHLTEAVFRLDARGDGFHHTLFQVLRELVQLVLGDGAPLLCENLAGRLEDDRDDTGRSAVVFRDGTVMQVHPHVFGAAVAVQCQAFVGIGKGRAGQAGIDHVAIEIGDLRPAFFHQLTEQKRMTPARETRVRASL